jgi:hypothetical protein
MRDHVHAPSRRAVPQPCPCENAAADFIRQIRGYSTIGRPCIQSASACCTHTLPLGTSVLDPNHISSTGPLPLQRTMTQSCSPACCLTTLASALWCAQSILPTIHRVGKAWPLQLCLSQCVHIYMQSCYSQLVCSCERAVTFLSKLQPQVPTGSSHHTTFTAGLQSKCKDAAPRSSVQTHDCTGPAKQVPQTSWRLIANRFLPFCYSREQLYTMLMLSEIEAGKGQLLAACQYGALLG